MTAGVIELVRPKTGVSDEPGGLREERRQRRGSTERAAIGAVAAAIAFQPLLHPSGPGNSSPVDVFTLGALVAVGLWASTCGRKLRAPYVFGMALFILAGASSGIVSPLPTTSLMAVLADTLVFSWCMAIANLTSRARAMRTVLVTWSWAAMFWAGVVVCAYLTHNTAIEGITPKEGNRVLFTFGDPNYAALYWVMSIFVVYAACAPRSRWIRLPGYGLLFWALVLTESNGGMLELAAGVACIVILRAYRRRGPAGALAVALTLFLVVGGISKAFPMSKARQWALDSHQALLVNSLGRSDNSSAQRKTLVHEGLQLYQSGPKVVGLGPMTTKPLLADRAYPYAKEAHDDYLAALVERGPLGVIGVSLLFGALGWRTIRVAKRPLLPAFAAAVPRPAGLVATILSLAVAATYYEILHFRFAWALFAIVAVLATETTS
jgi:hypothetical protein